MILRNLKLIIPEEAANKNIIKAEEKIQKIFFGVKKFKNY